MKKLNSLNKKLSLKKETVTRLSSEELEEIKAKGFAACWENLLTLYHCDVIWTGERPQ